MPHVKKGKKIQASSFRKMAIGAWNAPNSSQVYTKLRFDITDLEQQLNGCSWTHVFVYAMGQVMKKFPELNRVLIRNNLYQRTDIQAFVHTHIRQKGGFDLLGVTITDVDKKSVKQIAKDIASQTRELRNKQNSPIERTRNILKWVPTFLAPVFIKCLDFWVYTLNFSLAWLGLPKDPYGSFGVTAVGSFGFEEAYVPLFPFSRMPLILAVGKPCDEMVFDDDNKIVKRRYISVCFTMDHRYFDGAHMAKPLRYLKKILSQLSQDIKA